MERYRADYLAINSQISGQVSRGSAGEYHSDERAGVARLSWRDTCQLSRQVSRGSAGDYQADERAGVARLSWRVSGRCSLSGMEKAMATHFSVLA